jgi:hypothetical protein
MRHVRRFLYTSLLKRARKGRKNVGVVVMDRMSARKENENGKKAKKLSCPPS